MLNVSGISLKFGDNKLFEDVNIKFTPGNCYGLIGANGAGKSTFIKILSGDLEPNSGNVSHDPDERMAVLRQDHYAFDDEEVLNTVITGHDKLSAIIKEREELYSKEEFSDEDGMRMGDLEAQFGEMGGYEAESEAATILNGLGVAEEHHSKSMKELDEPQKVKVLLARALFGQPDILLLDEPTNGLDVQGITWLENFLYEFENTVIVVSHDRHFLNQVCTHMADLDRQKITMYVGNYDFWYQSAELATRLIGDRNKKMEEKRKDLQTFIQRFSANAAKSKQATSRKKLLEKMTLEELKPSSRQYPYINIKPDRDLGKDVLRLEKLAFSYEDYTVEGMNLIVMPGDKIALVGSYGSLKTAFMEVIYGEREKKAGEIHWGKTVTCEFLPKDNNQYFQDNDNNLIDWLRNFSEDKSENFIRGFLGKMLFTQDQPLKEVKVCSGGEKVRLMFSKAMLKAPNVLLLDEPTNHLDLESITSLNEAIKNFPGVVFLASHDHQLIQTTCNRMLEITPEGVHDKSQSFDEYLEERSAKK